MTRLLKTFSLALIFCFFPCLVFAADTIAPTGSIKINNLDTYTKSVNVTLNLSATDTGSGVSQMKFSNNNSTWSVAETYALTKTWALATGSGTKRVYVKFKDSAGNWSSAYSDSIILDTALPTGSIKINNGAAKTNSTSVTLNLSASDSLSGVSQMSFSNDNTNWSTLQTYSTTKVWTITSGDGTKTIYAKFKDGAGNLSSVYSDTIILDATAPVISNVNTPTITGTSATISWSTNESATGQVEYGLTTTYGTKSSISTTLVTTRSITISSLKQYTLYHYRVISKDSINNQNVSGDYTFTTKDTILPTGSIKINNGATSVNTINVTLNLTATDTGSGLSQMQFSNNNSTWSTPENYAITKSWILATGTGTRTVYVKFKDKSGNWSNTYSDSISLVNQVPQVGTITPSSGSSGPLEAVTFTTTYSDSNGWQNIKEAQLLINASTSGVNCFNAYYDQNTNKFYLRNDANTAWLGGYTSGSSYVIQNSYVSLNCAQATVSGSGTNLTIKWPITFKATSLGIKNLYLGVKDDLGLTVSLTSKGTWNIAINQGPTLDILTPQEGQIVRE